METPTMDSPRDLDAMIKTQDNSVDSFGREPTRAAKNQ